MEQLRKMLFADRITLAFKWTERNRNMSQYASLSDHSHMNCNGYLEDLEGTDAT